MAKDIEFSIIIKDALFTITIYLPCLFLEKEKKSDRKHRTLFRSLRSGSMIRASPPVVRPKVTLLFSGPCYMGPCPKARAHHVCSLSHPVVTGHGLCTPLSAMTGLASLPVTENSSVGSGSSPASTGQKAREGSHTQQQCVLQTAPQSLQVQGTVLCARDSQEFKSLETPLSKQKSEADLDWQISFKTHS